MSARGGGQPALIIEIRAIVERAAKYGVACTSDLIYGSLEREVPAHTFQAALSNMVKAHQVLKSHAPGDERTGFYAPGPIVVTARASRPQPSMSMGFMARARLMAARANARKVWRAALKAVA